MPWFWCEIFGHMTRSCPNLPTLSNFCKQYKVPWRRAINGIQIRFTPYHSTRRYHQQSKSLQLGCSRNIWAISTFTDWSIENRDSDIFFFEVLQKQSKKFLVPSIQGFFATGQLYYLRLVWTNPRLWRQTQQETHPIESPILESWSSNHQKSHIHLNIHITTSQLLEIAIHLLVKIKHK